MVVFEEEESGAKKNSGSNPFFPSAPKGERGWGNFGAIAAIFRAVKLPTAIFFFFFFPDPSTSGGGKKVKLHNTAIPIFGGEEGGKEKEKGRRKRGL